VLDRQRSGNAQKQRFGKGFSGGVACAIADPIVPTAGRMARRPAWITILRMARRVVRRMRTEAIKPRQRHVTAAAMRCGDG